MKNYTAIYSSESLKNIQYSFISTNLESAILFCSTKFCCFPNIILVENTEESKSNEGVIVWANGYVVK